MSLALPRAVGSLLLVAALSSACATHDATLVAPIIQGTAERDAPWVVMVVQQTAGSTRVRLCTGAVVAPRVVLTAKHCVFRSVAGSTTWAPVPEGELSVRTGTDFRTSPRTLAVASVATTEGPYHDDDGRSGGDIALVTVSEDLGVAPKRIGRSPAAAGTDVRILGFGYTMAGASDPADLGALHRGTATVARVEANVFSTAGPQWTCTGDSGGPALDVARDELVGVTSIGPTGCRVSTSYYTRVDRYLALIDGVLGGAAPDAGAVADAPATTTDVSLVADVGAAPDAATPGGVSPQGGCAVAAARPHDHRWALLALLVATRLRRRRVVPGACQGTR